MSCNYLVTAYKPTAVTGTVKGNFTSPGDLNLIQAKGSYLVVNRVTPEGLKPVVDVNINGRITIMQLFRPKASCFYLMPPCPIFRHQHGISLYRVKQRTCCSL